jgi:hypothetical protein
VNRIVRISSHLVVQVSMSAVEAVNYVEAICTCRPESSYYEETAE